METETRRKVWVIINVLLLLILIVYAMQNVKAQEANADINLNISAEGNVTGSAEISIMTDDSVHFANKQLCEFNNSTINRTISVTYASSTANIMISVGATVNNTYVIAYIHTTIEDAIQHGVNITLHTPHWNQKITGRSADFFGSQKIDITASRNLTMWAKKHSDSVSISFNSTTNSSATVTISREALMNIAAELNCNISDLHLKGTAGINRTAMNSDGSMTIYISHFSNQTVTFSNKTESGIAGWLLTESYGGAPIWAWMFIGFLVTAIVIAHRRR